jgi:hypothetical protein
VAGGAERLGEIGLVRSSARSLPFIGVGRRPWLQVASRKDGAAGRDDVRACAVFNRLAIRPYKGKIAIVGAL